MKINPIWKRINANAIPIFPRRGRKRYSKGHANSKIIEKSVRA